MEVSYMGSRQWRLIGGHEQVDDGVLTVDTVYSGVWPVIYLGSELIY